jgi:hypothetical protein
MRKKQHKCINPRNRDFDQFYMINYLEIGKLWHDIKCENDIDDKDDDDFNKLTIEDWIEPSSKEYSYYCLFCDNVSFDEEDQILEHLIDKHDFDLKKVFKQNNLSFYSQVKLINYIRRQVS